MATADFTTKRCTKCGIEYPATTEYFYQHKGFKSGLRADCKNCVIQRSKSYREVHIEEERERARRYYQNHRAEKDDYSKKLW